MSTAKKSRTTVAIHDGILSFHPAGCACSGRPGQRPYLRAIDPEPYVAENGTNPARLGGVPHEEQHERPLPGCLAAAVAHPFAPESAAHLGLYVNISPVEESPRPPTAFPIDSVR